MKVARKGAGSAMTAPQGGCIMSATCHQEQAGIPQRKRIHPPASLRMRLAT